MKPAALLTGSTGYIGQNLLSFWFQQREWDVVCVDRSTGFDLAEYGWKTRLPEREVDVVVHLAQSRRYHEFPAAVQDMFRVNVVSTIELLEWARTHGVRRFIFASTGTVYAPHAGKLTETAECAPSSMYAATKLCAELLLQPYSDFLEVVIARLFGVYGPGQRQMLIADTIQQVQTGREIRLAGGAGLYMTPLFIDDCVRVLDTLAMVPLERACNILNVAGDELLSLGEIVHEVAKKLHISPVIKTTDDLPKYLCGDNTRLKTFYRNAFLSFRTGLGLTLQTSR